MKTTRPAPLTRRAPARPEPRPGVRLRARTAVADDLGYEPEPHMKLSRALFIVVLMHIVVIAGLFGFQSLRDRAGRARADLPAENYTRTVATLPADDPSTARIHYVRSGETLSSIAAYYNVPLKQLAEFNSIVDASQILAGQEIKIPPRAAQPSRPLDPASLANEPRSDTAPPVRPAPPPEVRSRPLQPAPSAAQPAAASAASQPARSAADTALREKFLETRQNSAAPPASSTGDPLKDLFLETRSESSTVPSLAAQAPAAAPRAAAETVRPAAAPVVRAAPAASAPQAAPQRTYTVQKGDNPVAIAKRFNVSYSALLKANNITDPRKLQVGQKLIIPRN